MNFSCVTWKGRVRKVFQQVAWHKKVKQTPEVRVHRGDQDIVFFELAHYFQHVFEAVHASFLFFCTHLTRLKFVEIFVGLLWCCVIQWDSRCQIGLYWSYLMKKISSYILQHMLYHHRLIQLCQVETSFFHLICSCIFVNVDTTKFSWQAKIVLALCRRKLKGLFSLFNCV